MALSRFIDQRGRPLHIYSDNGTNFVGANKEIKQNWASFDWDKIMGKERFHPIKWHFMPPYSPHFGGAWERMVQSVKKVLRKTLHEKFPKDQVLWTLLKGAEGIVNSRPLTYVSGDPADAEALTPNHFLRGFNDVGPSIPGNYEDADEVLRIQWRKAQMLLDLFWLRWTKEVLPEMVKRQKWNTKQEPLRVGEIVRIVDENLPRNMWVKGVVSETFPGSDGQVRVVDVTTADFKTKRRTTYRRGVDKIAPLGIRMGNQAD